MRGSYIVSMFIDRCFHRLFDAQWQSNVRSQPRLNAPFERQKVLVYRYDRRIPDSRLYHLRLRNPEFLHQVCLALRTRPSRGDPTNLDSIRSRDKWNSAGYAAAASG